MSPGPGFDRGVAARPWLPFLERWADRNGRRDGGEDWWPAACQALDHALDTFDPAKGGFSGHLWRNLRWKSCEMAKRHRRRAVSREHAAMDSIPSRPEGVGPESLDELHRSLDRIPPGHSEILRAHYLDGRTLAEIARQRGVTRQAVHHQAKVGLAELRALLEP